MLLALLQHRTSQSLSAFGMQAAIALLHQAGMVIKAGQASGECASDFLLPQGGRVETCSPVFHNAVLVAERT